jgi:phosphinothricin acetyltransferase
MTGYEFVPMRREFLPAALEVYQHYVRHSTATFQIADADLAQMEGLLLFDDPRYRSFAVLSKATGVSAGDQPFLGYGIITRFKPREAFDRTAEITVYLAAEATGRGIGPRLVDHLEAFARTAGLHVLVALISGENAASVKLFERAGYDKCAHYREVGHKFGRVLDLVSYQKIL